MSHPRVSVLMPVYNAERYAAASIQSILDQTFSDFELVIIDDGSHDGSLEVIRRYQRADNRIVSYSRPNTGIVGALNDALALARGDLIARMDADDISMPHRFERQVAFLETSPEYEVVSSRVLLTDPDGEPIFECPQEITHEEIMAAYDNIRWAVVTSAAMMRRATLREIGGYRPQYDTLEDLDLMLRLSERGRLHNLPEVLYKYRQHFSTTCFRENQRQSRIREAVYREAFARQGKTLELPSKAFDGGKRSVLDEHSRWAWRALQAGNIRTARKHARWVVRHRPFDLESWRLLCCCARGH